MKLATVRVGGAHHVAIVQADGAVDLAVTARATGDQSLPAECWTNPVALLDRGPDGLAAAAALAAKGRAVPLAEVQLGAPIPNPRKLLLLAGNYADHIMEGGGRVEAQDKETPRVFMKPPSTTVQGPYDTIPIPPVATFIDWEAELAFVIGRRCKAVKRDEAVAYVMGYMVLNDVSERKLKIWNRSEDRARDVWFDWLNGKWLDGFAPMGPWLTTADEVADPHALDVSLWVNGELQQSGNTGQMLFHVGDIIEYISSIVTLEPGDIVATGTPAGVGVAKGIKLGDGDVVRVEVGALGALENRCVAVDQ